MKTFDVAIIGAGPAGSAAAIGLAQRGCEIALFDKQSSPREKLCGDFVNPINLPLLRRLGVENEILALQHGKVAGFRITAHSGAAAEARFPSGGQGVASGLGLRRALLDHALVRKAASLGITVRLNSRIDDLLKTERGWEFKAGTESWRAKILIGADGRNSWVAERLGLSSRNAMHGRAVGFQARLKSAGTTQGKVEIHLFPGGYAGVIGLGDGELNLCLALDRRMLPRVGIREYLLTECLPQNPYLKDRLERSTQISRFRSAYPIYFPRRRYYGDRALLAGDAARVSEPVTGEGVYFALRSGLLAAEACVQALAAGDLSGSFLRRYERSCNHLFRTRLSLNALTRFAVYRPALLTPLIGLFARHRRVLDSLVGAVCAPGPLR